MERRIELVISSCQNGTWQGTLRAGEEAVPFRSELELLRTLARILPPEGLDRLEWRAQGEGPAQAR